MRGPVPGRDGPVPAPKHARMVPSWPKHVRVVRAGGLEPPRPVRVCGFSYHFGFRRPATRVRGLDYPFTIPRERFRCCPSSLYTFPKISGLGSGLPVKVSPTLSSSTPPVSLAGTQFLKSYRSYFALDGSNSQRLYICLVMNQMQRPIDCIELLRQV